jgi:DNA repair protein RadC
MDNYPVTPKRHKRGWKDESGNENWEQLSLTKGEQGKAKAVKENLLEALPIRERPVVRLTEDAKSLSLMELLAVQVGGPRQMEIAQAIITQHGKDIRKVKRDDLMNIQGIGVSLSGRIMSAIELGRRISVLDFDEQPTISSPALAAAFLQYEMSGLEQESLRTILLDARNRLIRVHEVYKGSLTTSVIRTGEVFREAIRQNAAGMIVVHNHPSGDPSPSPEDLAVTRNLVEAGRLLDIPILDHVVIGRGRFVSMREQGLGFAEK